MCIYAYIYTHIFMYVYNYILLSIKILSYLTIWIIMKSIILSKISQEERGRQILHDVIYGWNLKK